MKKLLVNESEKNKILKMHGFIKEQAQDTQTDEQKLNDAIKQGCISKYTWFIPDAKPIRKTKSGKHIIYGKGSNGNEYYFFADMTVINANTGTKKTWECVAPAKPEPPKPDPNKPPTLNDDQKDAVQRLAVDGWVTEPKPSQIAIDNREAEAADLSDPNSTLGRTYSKYFPKDQFPKGFFVYRKVKQAGKTPGKAEKIEVDGQMCKTAISSLHDHMENPSSVPLSNAEINSYIEVAQKCAEPVNRKRFRFGMNKQLQAIARKYGIETRY